MSVSPGNANPTTEQPAARQEKNPRHTPSTNGKRKPVNPPTRTSSVPAELRTESEMQSKHPTTPPSPRAAPAPHHDDDKPPPPPPKKDVPRSPTTTTRRTTTERSLPPAPIQEQRKLGIFESIMVAIVSCCAPTATIPDEELPVKRPLGKLRVAMAAKETVEMESISKKEDDRPTTSTGGIPDNELAILSLKAQAEQPSIGEPEGEKNQMVEEPVILTTEPPPPHPPERPSTELDSSSAEKSDSEEEGEQSYIDKEIRRRSTHEPTDYEAASAERHLRDSVQIQAPFPPEDESDAFVVSPTPPSSTSPAPQVSIQSTGDSEESSADVDDVPRPFPTFDDGQPRVYLPSPHETIDLTLSFLCLGSVSGTSAAE